VFLTENLGVPCVDCPDEFEGTTLNLRTLPDGAEVYDLLITNQLGDADGNYDTLLFERRFKDNFFFNASFDHQWRSELTKWFYPGFNMGRLETGYDVLGIRDGRSSRGPAQRQPRGDLTRGERVPLGAPLLRGPA
jgi:hypothetical protein